MPDGTAPAGRQAAAGLARSGAHSQAHGARLYPWGYGFKEIQPVTDLEVAGPAHKGASKQGKKRTGRDDESPYVWEDSEERGDAKGIRRRRARLDEGRAAAGADSEKQGKAAKMSKSEREEYKVLRAKAQEGILHTTSFKAPSSRKGDAGTGGRRAGGGAGGRRGREVHTAPEEGSRWSESAGEGQEVVGAEQGGKGAGESRRAGERSGASIKFGFSSSLSEEDGRGEVWGGKAGEWEKARRGGSVAEMERQVALNNEMFAAVRCSWECYSEMFVGEV
jgi:hypothetical protein